MKAGHETPVNATAARVMARGESFEFAVYAGSRDSAMPLPTKLVTPEMLSNPGFSDLTGKVVGRLKVIGPSALKPGRWVCKCTCGAYTLRKAQGLRAGTTASAPCDQCYQLALAKKNDLRRRTGKIRGTEEFMA